MVQQMDLLAKRVSPRRCYEQPACSTTQAMIDGYVIRLSGARGRVIGNN